MLLALELFFTTEATKKNRTECAEFSEIRMPSERVFSERSVVKNPSANSILKSTTEKNRTEGT
jgi:hypothetical protein